MISDGFLARAGCLRSRLLLSLSIFVHGLAGISGLGQSFLPVPLPRAHAHNDYEHARPLLDALDQGFCSVEADIYLVDGQLLVAHDLPKVKLERTLQALYLDPLRERVRANQGRVFPGGPPVMLLIDLKSDGAPTYLRLRDVLEGYRDMLTAFENNRTRTNAVTVVISGDRPWDLVASETNRLVGLDGRLPDLAKNPSPHLVPLVSDSWRPSFTWNGEGAIPEDQRKKLAAAVDLAHAQGRRIRFWGAADSPGMWLAHQTAGVDLINTDRLAELAGFLRRPPSVPRGIELGQ